MPSPSPTDSMPAGFAAAPVLSTKAIALISVVTVVGAVLVIGAIAIGLGVGLGLTTKTTHSVLARLTAPIVPCTTSATCGCSVTPPSFSSRIINGQPAALNSWPWMVYLSMSNLKTCSGFLISPRHVLTAASCVSSYGYNITVNLGINAYQYTFGGVNITNTTSLTAISLGDIAIVTLGVNLTNITSTVKPCCLTSSLSVPVVGVPGVIAGWGETSANSIGTVSPLLQQAVVQVQSSSVCGIQSPTDTLCASYGSISACPIDAGGPLMINYNNAWTCVGIMTGRTSTTCSNPIIFTDIAPYALQIQNITGLVF